MPPKPSNIYCLRCGAKTGNAGVVKKTQTSNGRNMLSCKCAKCGGKKNQFTK